MYAIRSYYVIGNEQEAAGLELNISASGAIKTVANDSIASANISEHFRVPVLSEQSTSTPANSYNFV